MKQFKFDDEQIVIDKYLPHNFLAEKMILSCLLINSDAIEVTIRNIPIDAFYFQNHQEIYRAIIFMYRNKAPIDILTLITFYKIMAFCKKSEGKSIN
jgi:replicative DNA helicase